MKSNNAIEVTLTGFAYGGEAVGRLPDGRAVFVPFGLPGETVLVDLSEEKGSFARGRVVKLLQASPQRITPRCRHFGACGGCHYQHLDYPRQLEAKRTILQEQLKRIAGLPEAPVGPVVPSPAEWRYRNQAQFHLAADGRLGYQAANSHVVVPIEECFLPETALCETWPQLHFEAELGLERVGLRLGYEDELMLVLESGSLEAPEMVIEELPISVVHHGPGGELTLAGGHSLAIQVGGRAFRVSAGSFFQVNTRLAERMVLHILDRIDFRPGMQVADLYCGVGLFSAFLAPRVARLIGVESSPSACADFEENLDEFDNVELYEAPVEQALPAFDLKPSVVLVDPPRAGLSREARCGVLSLQPEQIVYVSCDPSTLSRDAKEIIRSGYHLASVTPFDMFPQTYHIESVSIFERFN